MNKSCKYKLLHKDTIGSVRFCKGCGNLKVEIGHLMTLLSPGQFELIVEDFKNRASFYKSQNIDFQSLDPILICLNNHNLFLKLTAVEFIQVLELFEVANHMLEVDALINLP